MDTPIGKNASSPLNIRLKSGRTRDANREL
jgi:hypothetical protein